MSDEENFTSVFPSNCQPLLFPKNTASNFSCRLENPKVLNGQWEVAVKDLSFVMGTWNLELKRLRGGPLIQAILDHFQGFISGNVPHKMLMFSGELINS